MWDKRSFETLLGYIPFSVSVEWSQRSSADKYGKVNSLLATIVSLKRKGAEFLSIKTSEKISHLNITPMHRKLTDIHKKEFNIVGHHTKQPLLLAQVDELCLEIYFNSHFFIETRTGFRQYYPSASVILRCRNFLREACVCSPGSWGSDIIFISFDWDGTLVCETSPVGCLPGYLRKNFKGYKYIPIGHKIFLAGLPLSKAEALFLRNNGFKYIFCCGSAEEGLCAIEEQVEAFLQEQYKRISHYS